MREPPLVSRLSSLDPGDSHPEHQISQQTGNLDEEAAAAAAPAAPVAASPPPSLAPLCSPPPQSSLPPPARRRNIIHLVMCSKHLPTPARRRGSEGGFDLCAAQAEGGWDGRTNLCRLICVANWGDRMGQARDRHLGTVLWRLGLGDAVPSSFLTAPSTRDSGSHHRC